MRLTFDVECLLEPPEWPDGSGPSASGASHRGDDGLGQRARGPEIVTAAGGTDAAGPGPEMVEVLGLVCAGLSVAQIAEGLGVSTGTVMTRITRSLRLGHSGSDELVARARAILADSTRP